MPSKNKKRKAPPRFRTIQETGDWYDNHSTADLESKPARLAVDRRYDPTLTLRIPEDSLRRLKELADRKGMPTATLARTLLLERLDAEQGIPRKALLRTLESLTREAKYRKVLREVLKSDSEEEIDRAWRSLRD